MPSYAFTNSDGDSTEIYYSMSNAPKVGSVVTVDGVKWTRVYTVPQASMALSNIDPFSQKAFRDKTGSMKGCTLGEMFDASAELSARRKEKLGHDPVKQEYYDNYAKARKGHRHFKEKKEKHDAKIAESNKKLSKLGISIGLT
jgi:hypothetical protein